MIKYTVLDKASGSSFILLLEGSVSEGDTITLLDGVELKVLAIPAEDAILVECNAEYSKLNEALLQRSIDAQSIQTTEDFLEQYRKVHGKNTL